MQKFLLRLPTLLLVSSQISFYSFPNYFYVFPNLFHIITSPFSFHTDSFFFSFQSPLSHFTSLQPIVITNLLWSWVTEMWSLNALIMLPAFQNNVCKQKQFQESAVLSRQRTRKGEPRKRKFWDTNFLTQAEHPREISSPNPPLSTKAKLGSRFLTSPGYNELLPTPSLGCVIKDQAISPAVW